MDEHHKKILRENRGFIVNNLSDINGVVDGLLIHEILTEGMRQDVMEGENTQIKRARKLMDIIPRRGPFAFDIFCQVLCEKGQTYIAETLNPALKNAKTTPVPARPSSAPEESLPTSSASSSSVLVPVSMNIPSVLPIPSKTRHDKSSVQASSTPPKTSHIQNPGSLPTASIGANSMKKPDNKPTVEPSTNPGKPTASISKSTTTAVAARDFPMRLDFSLNSKDFVVKPVEPADLKLQLGMDNYRVTQVKRGRAVVISNKNFEDETYAERKSADNDSFRLQMVLKNLGFRCIVKSNLAKENLFQELKKERENDQLDMFVLVIMSYGGAGTVISTDGFEIPVKDIINVFSTKNCPSLIGKPKLFFIQACGTKLKDIQVLPKNEDRADESTVEEISKCMQQLNLREPSGDCVDTKQGPPPGDSPVSLDETSDMLVAMATSPDQDHDKYSSLFILGLSYVLSNFAKSDHILEIIRKVNELKWDESIGQYVHLCDCRHSLTKILYFLPGYAPVEANVREEDFHSVDDKAAGKS